MRVLALDTSTRRGSVALLEDGVMRVERPGDPSRPPAERLPAEWAAALAAADLTPRDIDLFAVASGPGSFTGLRIGIAAMQGLAVVTGRPMVAVSRLEALAHVAADGEPPGALVAGWIDAHRHDVFSALYAVESAPPFSLARLRELEPALVAPPAQIVETWQRLRRGPAVVAGDGATAYADLLDHDIRTIDPPLLAGAVARLAWAYAQAGHAGHPSRIQPLYVRRPDAEVARERQRHGHG